MGFHLTRLFRAIGFICAAASFLVPARAWGLEVAGGVGLGGVVAGTKPRIAISPHLGLGWYWDSGLLLSLDEMCSILPATNSHGVGVHNQASIALGYRTDTLNLGLGPAFSAYSMAACSPTSCARVAGLSLAGHARVDVYFAGPLGASVSANVDWIVGRAEALLGTVTAMVVAGPILRWSTR